MTLKSELERIKQGIDISDIFLKTDL